MFNFCLNYKAPTNFKEEMKQGPLHLNSDAVKVLGTHKV